MRLYFNSLFLLISLERSIIRGFSSRTIQLAIRHKQTKKAATGYLLQDTFRNCYAPSFRCALSSMQNDGPQIRQIDKAALEEILEDVNKHGRKESGYVIIDVRGEDEVASTGKNSNYVHTLPLPLIAQVSYKIFTKF